MLDNEWRGRIDAGESTAALTAELVGQYPEYREAIELFDRRYFDMLTGEVPGKREVISDLKDRNYEIYGLTNWNMETFPTARERFGILQMIDRYVVSAQKRLIKPDPRLFHVLLDRYNLRDADCIFIDDNPSNVAAATEMGMEGIVFCGANDDSNIATCNLFKTKPSPYQRRINTLSTPTVL